MRRAALVILAFFAAVSARAERLTFAGLQENEAIMIGYASSGGFHFEERRYVVGGGERASFQVYAIASLPRGQGFKGPERLVIDERLSEKERLGFGYYLLYLRGVRCDGCTTVNQIAIGYYRNGQQIGTETIKDASCELRIYFHDGKFEYGDERPSQITWQQYRAIVPPRELERKLVAEGKTLAP